MTTSGRPLRILFWASVSLVGLLPGIVASWPRTPVVAAATERPAPALLSPAVPAQRPISPGVSHVYRVRLTAGESLHVVIEQLGAEVAVSFADPAGKPLLGLDAPSWAGGYQGLYAIARTTGEHRLAISGVSGIGGYRLRLDPPRPATALDRARMAASHELSEGYRFHHTRQGAAAEQAYRRAIALWTQVGEPGARALALYRLGSLQEEGKRNGEALITYRQAFSFWHAGVEGDALLNAIGRCYSSLEQPAAALSAFAQAEAQSAAGGDRLGRAAALNNTAQIYTNLGEYQKALDLFGQALEIFRTLQLASEESITLDNIGEIRLDLGAAQEAIDACDRALTIQRRLGDRRALLLSMRNLGAAYVALNQWDRARAQLEETIRLARQEGDVGIEAAAHNGLSYVHLMQSDPARASAVARAGLRLARNIRDPRLEANALGNLGASYGRSGQTAEALRCFDLAASIYHHRKDSVAEAAVLFGRAETLEQAGRFDEAQRTIETSLQTIERFRTAAEGRNLRASFFAARQGYFELYVRVLMKLDELRPGRGYDVLAFEASESTRARTLLDALALTKLDLHAGAAPALLRREAALQGLVGRAEQERQHAAIDAAPDAGSRLSRLDVSIRDLTTDLERLRDEMRRRNPLFATIAHPHPLSLRAIQRQLLDPGTLLLTYSLGEQESYLWSVESTSLRSHRLPGRSILEEVAKRAYGAVQAGDDVVARRCLEKLSELLLAPVAGELGRKRLLIVADGALQYVPFAALPEPRAVGLRDDLVVAHEIAYLPSASVARLLRQEQADRVPAPMQLAILGDPVFQQDDARVIARLGSAAAVSLALLRAPSGDAERSARDVGLDGLRRLPYSGREASAIFELVPAGLGFKATGFEATRELAVSPEMARFRILHFATHGFLDASHPELAGLVLSMVDPSGRPRDGFLHAYEVYGLHLNADLVVLSACRTALGAEVRGEGFMGLTRGFMYAGAPRVLVSLWNISDRATEELMERFYRAVLQQHLSPAAALRVAQLATRERWRSPYHWAAFELQGDWH